ncbi:HAD-IIA family hydrolase [Peteryoungia ipomoeae]|uniref:Haloacid dehalogenase n=1 Tax=Peteryoungia ipomoeae TaxID=1210932 RepID=A0A4S8NRH2_9HYPH|nr:HAD family hydrolase [Peteryoungia ipomoeae]THV19860.1 haloacid dehalogenase [Peteryoungia ipomoeae]
MTIRLSSYKAILCDLDGCLIAGEVVLPGARELLAGYGDRLIAVSNNSTDTPTTLALRLANLGLTIPADRMVLAGATAMDILAKDFPGARVAAFASPALRAHAEASGLVLADEDVDFVFLARDICFSYERLTRIVNLVRTGAALLVANVDATHPGAHGGIVPETGALLAAVATCLPKLEYRSIGKPDEALFQIALKIAGAKAGEAIFIGDNLDTDGKGARRMNIPFAHIGGTAFATVRELVITRPLEGAQ